MATIPEGAHTHTHTDTHKYTPTDPPHLHTASQLPEWGEGRKWNIGERRSIGISKYCSSPFVKDHIAIIGISVKEVQGMSDPRFQIVSPFLHLAPLFCLSLCNSKMVMGRFITTLSVEYKGATICGSGHIFLTFSVILLLKSHNFGSSREWR